MSRNAERETTFVSAFVLKQKRQGALKDLVSKEHRTAFFDRIRRDFGGVFEGDLLEPLPASTSYAPDLFLLLRERGAPKTCYVMSSIADIDAREMALLEALERVVGAGEPSILCCVPGSLAFFETWADPGSHPRFLLEKARG